MSAIILRGDARHLPLPDASVDLIVTSPPLVPYFALRSYSDNGEHYEGQIGSEKTPAEYLENLWDCTAEWVRVLKPGGSIFVNLGDKYSQRVQVRRSSHQPGFFPGKFEEFSETWAERSAKGATRMPHQNVINDSGHIPEKSLMGLPWRYALGCMDRLGLILRAEIVWAKPNSLPESVTDRVRRAHEQVFHLVKQPRYYSAVDEIREPYLEPDRKRADVFGGISSSKGVRHAGPGTYTGPTHYLGKLPGSVWEIASQPLKPPEYLGIDHFAAYPPELVRRIVLGWSPREICTECGEGRRPVTRYTGEEGRHPGGKKREDKRTYEGLSDATLKIREITGYACACTPYTDHKATQSARKFNRYANGLAEGSYESNLGAMPRTGPWREYHLDDWDAPGTVPGIVCDPFGGTGTTALVASVLGRTGITVDRSADYCRLAQWRINDPKQRAKVLGKKITVPEIPEEQAALSLEWE